MADKFYLYSRSEGPAKSSIIARSLRNDSKNIINCFGASGRERALFMSEAYGKCKRCLPRVQQAKMCFSLFYFVNYRHP